MVHTMSHFGNWSVLCGGDFVGNRDNWRLDFYLF